MVVVLVLLVVVILVGPLISLANKQIHKPTHARKVLYSSGAGTC